MIRTLTVTLDGNTTTMTTQDEITIVELLGVSEWLAVVARTGLIRQLTEAPKVKTKPAKRKSSAKEKIK